MEEDCQKASSLCKQRTFKENLTQRGRKKALEFIGFLVRTEGGSQGFHIQNLL